LLLEADPAEHRAALRGAEGNRGRFTTLGAGGASFRAHPGVALGALRLALLAAFGIVLEFFIVKEELLTSGKDKLRTAVNALQNPVDKLHGRLPQRWEYAEIGLDLERRAGPVSLSLSLNPQQGPGPQQIKRLESIAFRRAEKTWGMLTRNLYMKR
jgi:hypothetical protein